LATLLFISKANGMESKFYPGDTVVLKSKKSRKMVIKKENEDGEYTCEWQDLKGAKQSINYAGVLLKKWKPS